MQNYTKLSICLQNIQLTVFVYFYIILSLEKKGRVIRVDPELKE